MTTHVVALVTAKPGSERVMKKTMMGLVNPTESEAGLISYVLAESPDHTGIFVTIEQWETPEAFAAHMSSAHVQAALEIIVPASAAEPVIYQLEAIAEINK